MNVRNNVTGKFKACNDEICRIHITYIKYHLLTTCSVIVYSSCSVHNYMLSVDVNSYLQPRMEPSYP